MKKLIILLIIPLILTGCYDYNELSDLAIVSGIGIDFEEDEFIVTFEILSTKKEGETSASSSTYNVSSKGSSVVEAFSKNGTLMDKIPYFEHVDVIVISEEVAKNHLKEVSEYIIRTSKLRNETYLAIASNYTAKEVISNTSTEKPVAASFITNLLENNKNSASAAYYIPYTEVLNSILTKGEDAIVSVISLKEKEEKEQQSEEQNESGNEKEQQSEKEIELIGLGIFKDYELKHIFNTEESSIINLLNNFDPETVFFEKSCHNGKIVFSVYESEIKIEPNNENLKIGGKLNIRINEDTCGSNLRDEKTYEELQKEFTKIVENKMTNVLLKFQKEKSNALKIGKSYYNKYRKPYYELWTTQNIAYDLDLKINKKGLIFEVTK